MVKTINAYVQEQHVVIRSDLEGLLKMRRGFIVSVALGEGQAQIVFYAEIGWGDCERVLIQSEAVMPTMNLRVREGSKDQQDDASYRCTERRSNTPALGDVR